jgi:hypothetical protein
MLDEGLVESAAVLQQLEGLICSTPETVDRLRIVTDDGELPPPVLESSHDVDLYLVAVLHKQQTFGLQARKT